MSNTFDGRWEKRWHPLRQEWIVYSAHRNSRPWQGAGLITPAVSPSYDPGCYLCPGNKRVSGVQNPDYDGVFIFNNDHPVVGKDAPAVAGDYRATRQKARAAGIAKVVCYDPSHNTTLSHMSVDKVAGVFKAFRDEMVEFNRDPEIKHVLIFENKGEAVGVSNPHPHCQIYATDFVFRATEQHLRACDEYRVQHGKNLFDEIVRDEISDDVRIIAKNDQAVAFIPFFARYAYEVMIFPRGAHATLITMSDEEINDLAEVFQEVVRRLDLNFKMSFPYVMTVMQAPVDGGSYGEYRVHLWIQPPYRQPGLIKYLAGPEIGGSNFMADTIPEEKAAELRALDVTSFQSN